MTHPVLTKGNTAVITGGASGIGLATAKRLAALGMNVVLADLGADRLAAAADTVQAAAPGAEVMTSETDVSSPTALTALDVAVTSRFGGADVLMNNAAIQSGSSLFGAQDIWDRVMAVNLWGVVHGSRIFGPGMIARGRPGLIINTGSKQGITTPPGDPAYNMAKAGVKVFTEALAHELRNTAPQISAHLLIPGFVWTGLTRGDRTEKPAAAWTPEQTADFLLASLDRGDFYILCPDNDVPRSLDEKRIAWAAGDIIENRPALSRWHPDWAEKFKRAISES
ncbi:MAG: SDR family NAD(P)-dependent oxidoreductase [Rhodobacterales bacterium]|jgi:NAD(P)-dependent dehydrogenase (short-subunit alcohol dehydrogenase family)|nr:SDR family NAD(P)-dependent oxidoreductase [Rhodobacterales bacterium]